MKLSCKRYQTWLFSNNNFGSNVECLLWNTHFKTPLELIRIFFSIFRPPYQRESVYFLFAESKRQFWFPPFARMDNSWIPTCMKKRSNHNFSSTQRTWKKSFSTEICILILFGFFKTWIFTFENWCFQTFEFPPPRLQCIYWNFFLHQRNVQKHFQFDEAEHKGYLWGEMYNLYKKKT